MHTLEKNYITLLLIHISIGMLIFLFLPLAKIYGLLILTAGLYWVIRNQNKNEEVLIVAAYLVGSEVFLRMTGGNPNHEFSKYGVMLLMLVGMYLSGFSRNAVPYWVFLLLLVPGVIVATQVLTHEVEMRKTILFNISGELCLGISSIYCYFRKVSLGTVKKILLAAGLPVISCGLYLTFYTPDLQEILTGTNSNFMTSGGFGPNQVATALGLGVFVFAGRMIFDSPTKLLLLANLGITSLLAYRGLLTFSRGGILTGLLMLSALVAVTFIKANSKGKNKILMVITLFVFAFFGSWTYTSINTGGLIDKRYQNRDASGKEKESTFSGREVISLSEIQGFLDNPVFGMGVAKGLEIRKQETGEIITSHNEITRLIGEHGLFGILALLILISVPLIAYLDNKGNIYIISFMLFWLLTINHAAMRTAAPAFIYALTLLKVSFYEKPVVYRKPTGH